MKMLIPSVETGQVQGQQLEKRRDAGYHGGAVCGARCAATRVSAQTLAERVGRPDQEAGMAECADSASRKTLFI